MYTGLYHLARTGPVRSQEAASEDVHHLAGCFLFMVRLHVMYGKLVPLDDPIIFNCRARPVPNYSRRFYRWGIPKIGE